MQAVESESMSMGASGWLSSSLLALALFQARSAVEVPGASLRYLRELRLAAPGPACAVLDAAVFAHSLPSLKDLRVFSAGRPVPYAIVINQAADAEAEPATLLNLRHNAHGAEFDLAMPSRAYTQVILRLDGKNFVAEATVTGMKDLSRAPGSPLGTFTIFDLSSHGLARSTTIALQESSFPFLHLAVRGSGFQVHGADVPPSREERTLFATVTETRMLVRQGDETIARFHVPAHVPVEQATVTVAPGFAGDFSREIRITATSANSGSTKEEVLGTILRVKRGAIQVERTSVTASLGANLQTDADVEVAVKENHAPTLPVASVTLSMRQRMICSNAPAPLTLLYGDLRLTAPQLQYTPHVRSINAELGPEHFNPLFRPKKDLRSWRRVHPMRWWGGLVGALLMLGIVTLFFSRRMGAR